MGDFRQRYGPWAVIAGASEGTGRAFAREIAARGLDCLLVARRPEPLQALAAELTAGHGVECATASLDLSLPDAIPRLVDAIGAREIGLFVNNAGADPNGALFLDADVAAWGELVARNVANVVRSCHHFASAMRARRRGGIILVGSGACYGGMPGIAVYAGSKAFDLCFGEALWAELRPHGVDVLNLILGRTDTPEFRRFLAMKGLPVPAGLADPDEIARVGLDRLALGPVHNWGMSEEEVGHSVSSAAARRERIVMLGRASGMMPAQQQEDAKA